MLRKLIFQYLMKRIHNANDDEIMQIIEAVVKRYSLVFPDWDVVFQSLPKDPLKRKQQLELTVEFLQKHP